MNVIKILVYFNFAHLWEFSIFSIHENSEFDMH